MNAKLVAWPNSSSVKPEQSVHPPYITDYRVIVAFSTLEDAQDFVNSLEPETLEPEPRDGTEYSGRLVAPTHTVESDPSIRLVGTDNVPVDTAHMPIAEGEPNGEAVL